MMHEHSSLQDAHTFGQWVKQRRKALGLTQANLAQRVSCSKSTINKIESDLRNPTKSLIELLAQHLKISPAEYAEFVHLAQPQLLVEQDDLLKKGNSDSFRNSLRSNQTYPSPLTSLIGRERDVAAVCSYLQQPRIRLLTLTGAGGTGKTRLALQVASDSQDMFADGVYFVSLAPIRDSALVLSTIVQALGLKSLRDQPDDELLINHLFEKRALLILDNFEQALSATKAIAELLKHTTHLKVLITSRTVLKLTGEHEFVVHPLAVPDLNLFTDLASLANSPAVVLFVQRAQAVQADFRITAENSHSVAEICARLDGLPLAIELAAARCKVLSPQAILARLTGAMGGALGLLAGGVQDLPARQQTIRQTIEWSYNLLTAAQQDLFRRLGFFVDGCTLDAVEEVYVKPHAESRLPLRSTQQSSVLDSVVALMDQSLIRRVEGPEGEPRFFMSETLREYAVECLVACSELEMVRRQHATYFLHVLGTIEPKLAGAEQEACMSRLDAEYNNIRAALAWSCTAATEMALRMAGVLWEYWLARGYLSEGRAWLSDVLHQSQAKPAMPVRVRAQALNGAGLLASVQGDQQAASVYLQESLQLFRELTDQMGEAWVLNHLGQTLNLSGHHEEAVPVFEASLQLFRALSDNLHSAWVLTNLGEARLQEGDIDRSLQLLSEARELFRALNHKRGIATATDRLGRLALFRQDSREAAILFSESLRLFGETGDREGYGWALHYLGRLAYEDGQYNEAIARLLESLRLFDQLLDRWGFAWSLLRLAKAVDDSSQSESAALLFAAADAMLVPLMDRMLPSEKEFVQVALDEAHTRSEPDAWRNGKTFSSEKILAWIIEQPFLQPL
jgi:predicted ATPase/transcriptional regulator with XRE-family HTH domain